jgi:hypothetical protein
MNKLLSLLLAASLLTACNSKPSNETAVEAPTAEVADSARIQQPSDEVSRPSTEGGTGDEMNLGKQNNSQQASGSTTYVCPMNCEGSQSNKPGKCPNCGMDLEKKS